MDKSNEISAVIIAKNEQPRIGKCMDSLKFAGEIIVINNASSDQTEKIALQKGARVIYADTSSFSELRNFGLKNARKKWILYIDGDESVTEELTVEIMNKIKSGSGLTAYKIKRLNFYLGSKWPHSDQPERLFLRSNLKGWKGDLHESPQFEGRIGLLSSYLIHNTHRNLEEMVDKTNLWSETEARLRYEVNHPKVVSWRLFRVMLSGFYKSYIKEQGIRAGIVGLIESIYQAFSMFITYAKLWEKQKNLKI